MSCQKAAVFVKPVLALIFIINFSVLFIYQDEFVATVRNHPPSPNVYEDSYRENNGIEQSEKHFNEHIDEQISSPSRRIVVADYSNNRFYEYPDDSKNQKRKLIIISAMFRSGSSFMGSIFDKNPDLIYYFEPLSIFKGIAPEATKSKLEMLAKIANCKIPFTTGYPAKAITRSKSMRTQCFGMGVCQWFMNTRLCEGEMCPKAVYDPEKSYPPQCRKQCTMPSEYSDDQLDILDKACSNSKAIVVKVIRIPEIQDLLPLYRKFDLKVVLLVRKPTVMMDSRLRLWENYHKIGWGNHSDPGFKGLKEDCDRSVKSKIQYDENHFLRRRTLIVRFEDIALDELEMAEKVYDFMNLEMHPKIRHMIMMAKRKRKKREQDAESLNMFGVNKKKNATSIESLKLLSPEDAVKVSKICQTYIDLFEYNAR